MKLKDARKKAGFTQATIAEIMGVTRQTYAKMESGEVDVTVKGFLKISVFLEVTMFDLL